MMGVKLKKSVEYKNALKLTGFVNKHVKNTASITDTPTEYHIASPLYLHGYNRLEINDTPTNNIFFPETTTASTSTQSQERIQLMWFAETL